MNTKRPQVLTVESIRRWPYSGPPLGSSHVLHYVRCWKIQLTPDDQNLWMVHLKFSSSIVTRHTRQPGERVGETYLYSKLCSQIWVIQGLPLTNLGDKW